MKIKYKIIQFLVVLQIVSFFSAMQTSRKSILNIAKKKTIEKRRFLNYNSPT
jgi:hypothetical protein